MPKTTPGALAQSLYWQEHVARYGTTPAQRERAAAAAARLRAQIEDAA